MGLIDILKSEMVPAMGCTEPAACALAGAKAREVLGTDKISKVEVLASRDIIKNVMGAGIPNCSLKGVIAAVNLGIAINDTSKGLNIFSSLSEENIKFAESLNTTLTLVDNVPALYVSVKAISGLSWSTVTVSGKHDNYSYIEKDGIILEYNPSGGVSQPLLNKDILLNLSLEDIVDFANNVNIEDIPFVQTAIDTNSKLAWHSINDHYGLQVGRTMVLSDDMYARASALAAAAVDARMSGCRMPVYINSGSGNQGIIVTVPINYLAECIGSSKQKIIRAVCVSELVGLALTARKGRLSALCGAFTASTAVACGYCYLFEAEDSIDTMYRCINNMIANLTGIVCDGAKPSCALKAYSCLEAAALSFMLARKGICPDTGSGIVEGARKSLDNLFTVSAEGMTATDKTIVDIMVKRGC